MVVRTLGVGVAPVRFRMARPTMEEMSIQRTKIKKFFGIFLIILGIIALLTPFTPGSWLAFIGLELLGIRIFAQEKTEEILTKIKNYFTR